MVLEDGYLIVEPIQRLVAAARAHKIPIVWICQKYRMDKYDKVTEKRVGTCYEGTWGAEQIDELPILPEDYVVNKRRYSGFFQTDLDLTLRDMGCEKVIVGGAGDQPSACAARWPTPSSSTTRCSCRRTACAPRASGSRSPSCGTSRPTSRRCARPEELIAAMDTLEPGGRVPDPVIRAPAK